MCKPLLCCRLVIYFQNEATWNFSLLFQEIAAQQNLMENFNVNYFCFIDIWPWQKIMLTFQNLSAVIKFGLIAIPSVLMHTYVRKKNYNSKLNILCNSNKYVKKYITWRDLQIWEINFEILQLDKFSLSSKYIWVYLNMRYINK